MKNKTQPKTCLKIQKYGSIYYGLIGANYHKEVKIKHTDLDTIKGKTYKELNKVF